MTGLGLNFNYTNALYHPYLRIRPHEVLLQLEFIHHLNRTNATIKLKTTKIFGLYQGIFPLFCGTEDARVSITSDRYPSKLFREPDINDLHQSLPWHYLGVDRPLGCPQGLAVGSGSINYKLRLSIYSIYYIYIGIHI